MVDLQIRRTLKLKVGRENADNLLGLGLTSAPKSAAIAFGVSVETFAIGDVCPRE